MPRRSVRDRRRTMSFLTVLIVLLALAAVGLSGAIIFNERHKPVEYDLIDIDGDYVEADDLPQTEVVLRADTYLEELPEPATEAPSAEPTVTVTPEPTPDNSDPNAALRPVSMGENLLPIYKKAFTKDHVIAITLDECSGAGITEKFVQLAQKYNAKLTLFPTGENILKNGMQSLLQQCLFRLGYEIENRGFTSMSKLFQCPSNLMQQEIWKQSVALNYVLGVRYQPHFLRTYGGLGENDPRTHAYLMQEGYLGVAHWTVNGSDVEAFKMDSRLTPGGIYVFKTSDKDLERMEALMDAANTRGYRMVTMNELFGYEANAYTPAEGNLLSDTMPDFDYDDKVIYDMYPGETSWGVVRMQERLGVLGYMTGSKADGVFGEATSDALRMFQAAMGVPATGVGDINTLTVLFSDDAPENPDKPAETPIPGALIQESGLIPSED